MIKILIVAVVIAAMGLVWAFGIEPNLLQTVRYKIRHPELGGLRVVFASDFHIAPGHEKRLRKIVREINKQQPDLILLGGDFVKGHKAAFSLPIEKIAAELAKLKAPQGVVAVSGNHDNLQDGKHISKVLQKNGITVLANGNVKRQQKGKDFYIAGVEDYYTRTPDIKKSLDGTEKPVLLLSHSPDIFPNVPETVDLTLAGHNHGGQFRVPGFGALILPSDYGKRYENGLIEEDGKKLLVSKGLGTSLMPLRFNCLPEIVVIEFE